MKLYFILLVSTCFFVSTFAQTANDSSFPRRFNLHFQTTYIYQYKPAFNAPYSGVNSISPIEEKQNSLTATAFLGILLWKNCEIYINPELAGGSGLSGAFGMGASTNGETYRVGDPAPNVYLARGYLQQTIGLGTDKYFADDAANQVGYKMPKKYIRFLIGKFSLGDVMDNNAYSNTPRTQFMNWALMNNAAWDYAANVRGYTYGFTTILQLENMAYKLSIAALPTVANGAELNTNPSEAYSLNAEANKTYTINGKTGTVRLLGYYNTANMGNYKKAIANADSEQVPDIVSTRKIGNYKIGFGINAEQQLNNSIGIFARVGWNDGASETWCYTEADRTIQTGISVIGKKWKRKDDVIGAAIVVNGLSQDHRNYLANGGLGFELGDGKLNYGYETATELYYSIKPTNNPIWISCDYQLVINPGYNKDRGPISVFSIRLHVEL